MASKKIELLVGLFAAIGIAALLMLALKVADSGISVLINCMLNLIILVD